MQITVQQLVRMLKQHNDTQSSIKLGVFKDLTYIALYEDGSGSINNGEITVVAFDTLEELVDYLRGKETA